MVDFWPSIEVHAAWYSHGVPLFRHPRRSVCHPHEHASPACAGFAQVNDRSRGAVMIWIAFGALAVFMFGGMPIVFALGLSSVLAIYFGSDLPMMLVAQRIVGQIDTFALLAVPFFVLVGEIMDRGGMARQLVRVSECIVGHFRGGLAHVCILAGMLFARIYRSSPGD